MKLTRRMVILACLSLIAFAAPASATDQGLGLVLITNDDGIQDKNRLLAIAHAVVRAGGEPVIIVSQEDRSGSSNYLGLIQNGQLTVRFSQEHGVPIYVTDGFPADAVIMATSGLLGERQPDLVISGINSGTNAGWAWFQSGTIGIVRTAALFGIPAISVSGFDSDVPQGGDAAAKTISDWVVSFAGSDLVRNTAPGGYYTIAVPRIDPGEIQGVRVAKRSTAMPNIAVEQSENTGSGSSVWSLKLSAPDLPAKKGTDSDLLTRRFIVVTPMILDEVDTVAIGKMEMDRTSIPPWTTLED